MSRKIISDIKGFEGSVEIADPLTLSQAQLVENGMEKPKLGEDGRYWLSVKDEFQLPAVIACVEKWEIKNISASPTIDTFPGSPRVTSHDLIDLIFSEIRKIYLGKINVPNE